MTNRRVARVAAALVAAVAIPACATTYDASIATDASTTTTSSTLPSGTADELLRRLVVEAHALSGVMIADGDETAAAQRIANLWDAVRDEVNAGRPDLLSDFSANVALCARAVRFRRAADADKAAKNLAALTDAYLGSS